VGANNRNVRLGSQEDHRHKKKYTEILKNTSGGRRFHCSAENEGMRSGSSFRKSELLQGGTHRWAGPLQKQSVHTVDIPDTPPDRDQGGELETSKEEDREKGKCFREAERGCVTQMNWQVRITSLDEKKIVQGVGSGEKEVRRGRTNIAS